MVMRIAGGEGRGEFVRQSEHSEDETLIIMWGRNIQLIADAFGCVHWFRLPG
jgi:hypothetical protein